MSAYLLPDGTLDDEHGAGNLTGRRLSRGAAIREFCLCCMGGHREPWQMADGTLDPPYAPYAEVRDCKSETCPLHPYRTGRNPYTKRKGNAHVLRRTTSVGLYTARNVPESQGRASTGGGGLGVVDRPDV